MGKSNIRERNLVRYSPNKVTARGGGGTLGRIVFGLSGIAVCAKFFGFAEKLVIAHFFGTGDAADVYFGSMGVVLSIVYFVKELVYTSFLPVLADSLSSGKELSSARLFRKVFLLSVCFMGVTVIIIAIFPEVVTGVLMPGFGETKRGMAGKLLRVLMPGAFFLGLGMVTFTALNARKKFLSAALVEAGLKFFIVAGLVVLVPILKIYALAAVIGLGGLGCLLIQLKLIPESKFLFKPAVDTDESDIFGKVLLLMGPLVVGVVFSHISGLVDNGLASTLPRGQLACLGYSKKLIDAILLIGPVAVVTVVYSELSHLASTKNYEKFTGLARKALRLLIYGGLPVSCVLIALREPLIRFLFERGQFDRWSTMGTSLAFMVYGVGIVTFSLEVLLVHCFFALSDTKTPVKFGILCVCADIILAVILLRPFGCVGIAGAFVISKTLKIVILAAKLNRRLGGDLFGWGFLIFLAKLVIASGALCCALRLCGMVAVGDPVLPAVVSSLMLPAFSGLAVFVLCSYLVRIDELGVIISLIKGRGKI